MARNLSDAVNKLAAALLTIAGLVFLPIQIGQMLHSRVIGVVSAVVLFLVLGVRAAHFLIPTRIQRRFGVSRYRTPVVLPRIVERVSIDDAYSAVIDTTQTLVFLDDPTPDDLVDIIDFLPSDPIEEGVYSSPDSTVVDVIRRSPSTLAIRWRPNGELRPFVAYEHRTVYRLPAVYGDDGFYQAMYIDRDTGVREWSFQCQVPVERALAFQMPWHRSRITESFLYKRVVFGTRRGCEQPVVMKKGHEIQWAVERPKRGAMYVMFAVYAGQYPRVLASAEAYTFSARARALARRAIQRVGFGAPSLSR